MKKVSKTLLLLILSLILVACNSKSKIDEALDLIDAVDVERKTIDTSILGTNAFANDARFGTAPQQFREVRDTLGLKYVRMLFAWNDAVQASPNSNIDWSFYDHLVASLPTGLEVTVVITGIPTWMSNSANWNVSGNPRLTMVQRWIAPALERYGANPQIVAWQIWNEPNMSSNPDNVVLDLVNAPANYVEILAASEPYVRQYASGKLVLTAATTAINQNYPESLDYNRGMRDAGAASVSDVWSVHYYGSQYENVVRSGGVADFLGGLNKAVWVTESGAQGINHQLEYGERTWPFLIEKIPSIQRIFQYQFTDSSPNDVTYGLRNLVSGAQLSDLYIWLRDRE